MMNYLAIDLGNKRCGISISVENIALPFCMIERHKLVNFLKEIIIEKSIGTIVVGLPYDLYGKNLKQLEKTKIFIEKLKNIFVDIKIDFIDERFTTFEGVNILKSIKSNKKEIQEKKDIIASFLILESYMKKYEKI